VLGRCHDLFCSENGEGSWLRYDVLIPAHGETVKQIENLLFSIFLQRSSSHKLSRIFLCTDNEDLQEAFSDQSAVSFIYQDPGLGKPDAFNRMLQEAQAEVCIQISADCIPASENTFHFLLNPLFAENVAAVTSAPEPSNSGFLFLPNIVWKCHCYVQPKLNAELYAFKRELLDPLPLGVVHDDAFIHAVLMRKGFQVVYEPRAVVFNSVPETLEEFYAQRKKNVIGNLQIINEFRLEIPKEMRLRALFLMSLEMMANLHGRLDHMRGRIPRGLIGYNLKSTKTVKLHENKN
jgi:cellulose synthase/poly-beta-1,6-N-acetylglucosamine synthase-like glycosyltransferase